MKTGRQIACGKYLNAFRSDGPGRDTLQHLPLNIFGVTARQLLRHIFYIYPRKRAGIFKECI
ncbi:MAG TPA: hypothetical protein DIC22_11500 [Chitinophagaceae bacterium]|nr:hypothetical protein [Chitinophagaceae bacterium]